MRIAIRGRRPVDVVAELIALRKTGDVDPDYQVFSDTENVVWIDVSSSAQAFIVSALLN